MAEEKTSNYTKGVRDGYQSADIANLAETLESHFAHSEERFNALEGRLTGWIAEHMKYHGDNEAR